MSPMRLLENGIPLSLLLDLVLGPESADLMAHESASAADRRFVPLAKAGGHRPRRAVRAV